MTMYSLNSLPMWILTDSHMYDIHMYSQHPSAMYIQVAPTSESGGVGEP